MTIAAPVNMLPGTMPRAARTRRLTVAEMQRLPDAERDHAFLDPSPKVSHRQIGRAEELALIRRSQRPAKDGAAARALIALHAGFIAWTTRRSSRRARERADLYQEARLGFLRAVEMFDPTRGTRLVTYARAKIQNAVIRERNDALTGDIYVPLHVREALKKLRGGRPVDEPVQGMGCAAEVAHLDYDAVSLDAPAGDGRYSIAETLAHEAPTPEDLAERAQQGQWLMQAVRALLPKMSVRHRRIITLRYLEEMSREETAEAIGCTPQNVGQHEKKALAWIRGQLLQSPRIRPEDRQIAA